MEFTTVPGQSEMERRLSGRIVLIAAADASYGIGKEGHLLFSVSEDLRRFRRMTLNRTVLYGRCTLETFPGGRPLPGRRNLILSRTLKTVEGAEVFGSLEDALGAADEIFVIGGESVYRQTIALADRLELTVIHEKKKADAFFPEPDHTWDRVYRSETFREGDLAFHYETWLRAGEQRKALR